MKRQAIKLRIGLRGAMLLLTIFCLWLGFISINARVQRNAVDRIESLGGLVYYDWEDEIELPNGGFGYPNGDSERPDGPSAPQWLRSMLGDDYFQTVVCVSIYMGDVDESVLDGLPHVETVVFDECNLSDVSFLAHQRQIKHLKLDRNRIRDVGPIRSLHRLETLDLSDNLIQDCTPLWELKELYSLDVQGNPLSGSQIEQLQTRFSYGLNWDNRE